MKPFCILLFLLNAVCAGTITELNADMALEIARNTNPFHIPKLMLMNKIFYAALKPYNEIFQCIWKECEISSYDQFDDNSILWISPSAYFKPESSCANAIAASKSDPFTKDFLPKIGINNFIFETDFKIAASKLLAEAEQLTKGQISHLVISNNNGVFLNHWASYDREYSMTSVRSFFTGLRESGITHLDLSYTYFSYGIISIILQNLPRNLKEFVCRGCTFAPQPDSGAQSMDLVIEASEAHNWSLILGMDLL